MVILSVLIIITLPLAAPGQQVVGKVNVLIDGQPADETMVNLVG